MVDPVIDEHFRRSLGADYMNLFGNRFDQLKASPRSASQQTSNLNNKKSPQISPVQLKATPKSASPISNTELTENETTTENIEISVDDHFAKALGDTWKQLQQGKQNSATKEMDIDDIDDSKNVNDDVDDDDDESNGDVPAKKVNSNSPR